MTRRTDRFTEYAGEVSAARQYLGDLLARLHTEKFQRLRRFAVGIAQLVGIGTIAVGDRRRNVARIARRTRCARRARRARFVHAGGKRQRRGERRCQNQWVAKHMTLR